MSKQILSADKARAAVARGVDFVADAVKVTLGPRGRNVLLDRPGQPLATRDGVTVAKEVSNLPDPFENMGAAYAREVADAAVTEAGDGTTTATVLLQAIVRGGLKLVTEGAEPLLLADGIDATARACAETIRRLAVPATPALIRQVATISTHGDSVLGNLIADAAVKIGAEGVIEILDSRTSETTLEHLEGFYFERGWQGPGGTGLVYVNQPAAQKCVLENPVILISERIIMGGGQPGVNGDFIFPLLRECVMARRPFLIIAEDLTGDALNLFATQVVGGALPGGCFVKLPGFGETRAGAVQDLQIAVGARRIHTLSSTQQDDQLSSFTLDDLGTCARVTVSPTRTTIINGGADRSKLTERIRQLMQQARDASNPYEEVQLNRRVARLTNGVAVLSVGDRSEPAMLEKKARADDAIHACRAALQEGVVPGGGVALLRAAVANAVLGRITAETPTGVDDFIHGAALLLDAIREPALQIARNAGRKDAEEIVKRVMEHTEAWGYNAATGIYGDLYESGVVDPVKVTLVALLKAASIGALLLTTEVLVSDIPEPRNAPIPGISPVYQR